MLSRIHNSSTTILHDKTTPALLTSAEHSLYTTTALLSGLLTAALSLPRSSTAPLPPSIPSATSGLKTTLSTLRISLLSHPANTDPSLASLSNMHALSALRDTALAVRHAAAFLLSWHDREVGRDKVAGGCRKEVLAEVKALDGIAGKALAEVGGRVKRLKEALGEGGWLDRVLEWTLGGEQEEGDGIVSGIEGLCGRGGAEEWAGRVLESWVEGVKGWGAVRMEI